MPGACYQCQEKDAGEESMFCESCETSGCFVCGQTSGTLLICSGCTKAFHIQCLDRPLKRIPRCKDWYCTACKLSAIRSISAKRKRVTFFDIEDSQLVEAISETKDDYRVQDKADDIDKIYCNSAFFEQVMQLATITHSRGKILLLDALSFYSSRFANMCGFPPEDIIVPNNGPDARSMIEFSGKYCTVIASSMREYIVREQNGSKFSGVFLDYCGTVDKNQMDVELLFIKGMFAEFSILALTFTGRAEGGRDAQAEKIDDAIRKYAKTYGYGAEKTAGHCYGRANMFFMCFHLKRQDQPLVKDVTHLW